MLARLSEIGDESVFDTVLLRSLIAVADTGGFTRAAHRLHLTQSAISAHIRRLEREAGQKLLERTTRSVSLTPAGARLAGYARTILALHDDARASLGAGRRVSGTVYVGLSEEMVKAPIIDCMRRFSVAHPDAEVSLTVGLTGELLSLVHSGGLDIVLGSRCSDEERGEVLWSEPLVWARGPIALGSDEVTTPVPLAVFSDQCPYRAAAIEALVRAGRQWRIVCQSPSVGGADDRRKWGAWGNACHAIVCSGCRPCRSVDVASLASSTVRADVGGDTEALGCPAAGAITPMCREGRALIRPLSTGKKNRRTRRRFCKCQKSPYSPSSIALLRTAPLSALVASRA